MCEDCGLHGDHKHGSTDGHHHHHHGHEHDHHHDGTDSGVDEHWRRHADETDETIRIAVTGKGGVGKTTLSAAIARRLAAEHEVIAIDADPDMNLASTLGVAEPDPITEQQALIEERAGSGGGLVKLSPAVEDVLDSHSSTFGGGRLLTIGAPAGGSTGCMCPENSVIRSLVSAAFSEDFVVMDMEAGVEHLGRGTAESVDALFVVVEPSRSSIDTARRIDDLADDLGIDDVRAVVNKTRENGDVVRDSLSVPVVHELPYDDSIAAAGLAGRPPVEESEALREAATAVLDSLFHDVPTPR